MTATDRPAAESTMSASGLVTDGGDTSAVVGNDTPTVAGVDTPAVVGVDEAPSRVPRVRSPVDIIRTIVGATFVVVGVLLANVFDSTLLGLAADTATGLDGLPSWSRNVAGAVFASMVITGTIAVAVWSLLTTRYRRFVLYTAGAAAAAGLSMVLGRFVYDMVDAPVQRSFDVDVPIFRIEGAGARLNPADPLLAASVTTLTIASSFLSTRIVRPAVWIVAGYALVSVITVTAPPLTLLTDVGAGLFVGSLLLWVFGRHDVALRPNEIAEALTSSGHDLVRLEPRPDAKSNDWHATLRNGDRLVVDALSRDDWSAALLTRFARWIRLRRTGDHRPFLSLRRSVEHRALVALHTRTQGIDTPVIRAVAPAGLDGMILARDPVAGEDVATSLRIADQPGERSDDAMDDDTIAVLRAVWEQAARLQRIGVAHGRLRLSSFIVDADGRPWLVGFDRSELAAGEQRLGTDLAELLASTASCVGVDDAVRIAHDAARSNVLRNALPWLQPLALTKETRNAIGDDLELLRVATAEICGLEPEPPVRLERIDRKTLFVLGTLVLSGWFLLPQLADLDSLWSQVKNASWEWALIAVVCSAVTYLAATGSLLGAIPVRLAYWPAVTAQIASSFANRVTPAKVGGFATNLRYLQCKGVPLAVGATAVGLNAIAGVIMHLVLTLCALFLASGRGQSNGLSMPSPGSIGLVLAAIVLTVLVGYTIRSTRRLFESYVLPQLRSGWNSLRVIIRDPVRLLMLFGGSALITLAYFGAMYASLRAFGSTASLPVVALLFLTGSVVANAAPTPGGLGAAEAALIAALSTVEEASIVVPAVFLYRLVTFWLPILPGWLALTHLRRTDSL